MRSVWSHRAIGAALLAGAAALGACGSKADPAWAGYVEGEYVYVASPIAGALTTLAVRRGDEVKRGAPLFALDDQAERAAREEAAARASGAGAQAADLAKGKRDQEIAVVQAQIAQARAQAVQASAELARQEALVKQGFVSASRLDDVRAAARQARARVVELEASLRVAQLPARSDERSAAAASTDAALISHRVPPSISIWPQIWLTISSFLNPQSQYRVSIVTWATPITMRSVLNFSASDSLAVFTSKLSKASR